MKVAITLRAWFIGTVHCSGKPTFGVQPCQLPNREPVAGVATNVTVWLVRKLATQAVLQVILPAGSGLVFFTMPVPTPVLLTTRAAVPAGVVNRATTLRAWLRITVHCRGLAASGAQPVQPPKVEPTAGAAVRVTLAFSA